MSRDSKKRIINLLRQWSKLRAKMGRIEAERDQKLQPIKTRFEQRCAPILSAANGKLAPIAEEMQQLEREIENEFLSKVRDGETFKFTRVDEATAIAEVLTRTEREIDAETFFNSVPPDERNNAFFSCFKTLIGQAEKFLGKDRLNKLAHAKRNHRVEIREVK